MATPMIWQKDGGVCPVKVSVTDVGISWTYHQNGLRYTNDLQIHQILKPTILSEKTSSQLIVHYAEVIIPEKDKIRVRCADIVFLGAYDDTVTLKSQIEKLVELKEPYRPKRILLFINPNVGRQHALADFETIVSPLFSRCGVEVDSIVTKSLTHAPDVIEKYDFSSTDAVVMMGGDGSVYYATNALIRRSMKEAGIDYNDPDCSPLKPSIPFATIPCGSACGVAMLATGVLKDIETTVISIILGRATPYDVIGVTHGGRTLGYANLAAGCGVVIANTALVVENFRLDADCTIKPDNLVETEGPWPGWETVRCKTSEITITTDSTQNATKCAVFGEYVRPKLMTGRVAIDICVGSLWGFLKSHYTTIKYGRNRVPGRVIHHIECTAFRIRGIEEWREAGRDLVMHMDGESVILSNGAVYEARSEISHSVLAK